MKCKQCSRPAVNGKSRCVHHLKLRAEQAKRRSARLKQSKLCNVCGSRPPRENERRCDICARSSAKALREKKALLKKEGICVECRVNKSEGDYRCSDCAEKRTRRRNELKKEVFEAYGGVRCSCTKCPESIDNLIFYTIDHINGGGNDHRRNIGRGGIAIYRWLKKNGYPDGYRVMCWNCNAASYQNGGTCPHEEV